MNKNLELRYLEARKIRGVLETDELKKRYYKLLAGYEGEKEVYVWFVEYGSSEWLIYYDIWFEMGNGTQADFIVVVDGKWVLFEVKNYDGHFYYKNGECWLNHLKFNEDVMSRMDQRVRKLQSVADELRMGIEVVGAMVFINEHCTVSVDQTFNFEIVTRNALRHYLRELKKDHPQILNGKYLQAVKNGMRKYQGESPFKPTPMSVEVFPKMRKGITCGGCDGFVTEINYKKVYCNSCGTYEKKSDSIIRSAKQLRLLYFAQPEMITRKNMYEFMGREISETSVGRELSKHFKLKGAGSKYYYQVDL